MNRQMIEVETMRRGFDVLQELNRARLQKIEEHRKNGTLSPDDEDWADAEGNAVDELMILNAVEEAGEKAKEEIEKLRANGSAKEVDRLLALGQAVRGQLFHILTDYVSEKKDDPRIAPQIKTKTAKPRTGSSPQAERQKKATPSLPSHWQRSSSLTSLRR